jgi:hypothetical protein
VQIVAEAIEVPRPKSVHLAQYNNAHLNACATASDCYYPQDVGASSHEIVTKESLALFLQTHSPKRVGQEETMLKNVSTKELVRQCKQKFGASPDVTAAPVVGGALSSFTFGDKQAVTMTTEMTEINFSGKLFPHEAQVVAAFLPKCT